MNVAAVFVWFSLVVTKALFTREEYRLVCYVNSRTQHHPDMLAFSLDMADPFLCTHIIMAYMDLDQDYHITPFTQEDKTLCNSLNMLKERNPDLKTLLAVGGRNSTDTRLLNMSSDNTRRNTFVQSVLKHLRQEGFDGLDVVWQPPSTSNGAQGGNNLFTHLLKNQVQYWLSQGVDSHKLTLGFPAYSPVPRILGNERNYDKEDTELQEDAVEYTETDTTVRVMAYHEVCQYLKSGAVVKFDKRKKLIQAHEYDS